MNLIIPNRRDSSEETIKMLLHEQQWCFDNNIHAHRLLFSGTIYLWLSIFFGKLTFVWIYLCKEDKCCSILHRWKLNHQRLVIPSTPQIEWRKSISVWEPRFESVHHHPENSVFWESYYLFSIAQHFSLGEPDRFLWKFKVYLHFVSGKMQSRVLYWKIRIFSGGGLKVGTGRRVSRLGVHPGLTCHLSSLLRWAGDRGCPAWWQLRGDVYWALYQVPHWHPGPQASLE